MATYTTLETAEAAVLENADFEEVGSVSKAKAFISAVNAWMILQPESASNQSSSLSIGKSTVADLLNRARAYVRANDTSNTANNRVRFLSIRDGFRIS